MSVKQRKKRSRLLTLLLVGLAACLLLQDPTAVQAKSSALFGNCHDPETCGPEFSCEDPCWQIVEQMPPFQITCGEWMGTPWNGVGQCLGYCGDGYCNEFNEEEYGIGNCPDDCGYCGDDYCDPVLEGYDSCSADNCGYCGDDICQMADEGYGKSGYCPDDCGGPPPGGVGDECEYNFPGEDCGEDRYCTPFNYCSYAGTDCTPNDGFCDDSSDCCEYEACYYYDLWLLPPGKGLCFPKFPSGGFPSGPMCTVEP